MIPIILLVNLLTIFVTIHMKKIEVEIFRDLAGLLCVFADALLQHVGSEWSPWDFHWPRFSSPQMFFALWLELSNQHETEVSNILKPANFTSSFALVESSTHRRKLFAILKIEFNESLKRIILTLHVEGGHQRRHTGAGLGPRKSQF